MSSSQDNSEIEYLIDFLNKIPLNYTENYKEIKKLNLISLQEENQTLLEELKHQEETLKALISRIYVFINKSQIETKTQDDLNTFLKNKLETTIMKLNGYKKCKGELIQQNQNLLEKIQGLSEALDEQEKKCEEYQEKLCNYHEKIEIIERKQQINQILNTEESISDYVRDNIEEIRKLYPSYFCKCKGDYENFKLRFQDLTLKYQNLQEHCDSLEANNQNLSKSVSSLIDENQRLQILLISKPAEKKRKMKFSTNNHNSSKETIERHSFFKLTKRTASFNLSKKKKNETTSSNINESEKNISIFQEIENPQSFGTSDFKEDSHTLLSDMENSTISRQETRDLINDQGFCEDFFNQNNEILEKLNNLDVESPIYSIRTSKDLLVNTLKINRIQETKIQFQRIQNLHVEDKINYLDIAIFAVLATTNLWFKFMKKILNVIVRK